jgi:hypothetical protein
MRHEENRKLRVISMPAPQFDTPIADTDSRVKAQMTDIVDVLMPRLTTMVEAALTHERERAPEPESWIKAMLSPKNILSLAALTFSVGGAFALWSRAIVTEDKLDDKMAPLITALETNTKNIQLIQESVSTLVGLDRHNQLVDQAKGALEKFNDDYSRRVATWAKNKNRPYPEKSSDHIKAEIALEDLVRSRK